VLRNTCRSSKPEYRAQYPDARPFHFPQLNLVSRQRPRTVEVMAERQVQCAGESSSERSLKVRRLLREQEKAGAIPAAPFHATRIPVPARTLTGLTAAVQLRLRVAIGLQTLIVKSRLLTGENSVRIRGDPPFHAGVAQQRQQQFRKLPGKSAPRECESPRRPQLMLP
jgi:hypothetical protein